MSTTSTDDNAPFTFKPVSWAAKALGVSDATVRRMIAHGDLPGYKIGRTLRVKDTEVYGVIQPVIPTRRQVG